MHPALRQVVIRRLPALPTERLPMHAHECFCIKIDLLSFQIFPNCRRLLVCFLFADFFRLTI